MVKSVELIATEKYPSREGGRTCACFLLRQSQISHSAPLDPVIYDLGLHSSECYPTEAESLVPGSLTMIDALLSSSYLVLAISKIPRDRTCFGQVQVADFVLIRVYPIKMVIIFQSRDERYGMYGYRIRESRILG